MRLWVLSDCMHVLGVALALALLSASPAFAAGPVVVETSDGTPDAISIYVSSSQGNDDNDGLSESSPKATIAAGRAMLRDLNPDSLLLKRGDTWNESLAFVWESKSGRSSTEHMVLGAYGQGARPIIEEPGGVGFRTGNGNPPFRHLTVENIHFKDCNIASKGVVTDMVIQDCFVERGVISIQDLESDPELGEAVRDIVVRRCIVYRHSSTNSHAQGMFINGVDGITIEYCLLDHNGWDENIPGAEATIYNHNVYIQNGTKGLVFKNNVVARASSHGIQARPGGIVEDNFFVQNPLPILVGGGNHPEPEGVTGSVRGNVLLEGGDITDTLRRAQGLTLANIGSEGVTVADNIIIHDVSASPYGHGILLAGGRTDTNNVLIENNIVYDWRNSIIVDGEAELVNGVTIRNNTLQLYHHIDMPSEINDQRTLVNLDQDYGDAVDFSGNTYFSNADPERWFIYGNTYLTSFSEWATQFADDGATSQSVLFDHPTADAEIEYSVEVYNSQILGGEASLDAFLQSARENWGDEEYSAAALIAYFREGFGLGKGEGEGEEEGSPETAGTIIASTNFPKVGGALTLSAPTGSAAPFQWYLDDIAIAAATESTLSFPIYGTSQYGKATDTVEVKPYDVSHAVTYNAESITVSNGGTLYLPATDGGAPQVLSGDDDAWVFEATFTDAEATTIPQLGLTSSGSGSPKYKELCADFYNNVIRVTGASNTDITGATSVALRMTATATEIVCEANIDGAGYANVGNIVRLETDGDYTPWLYEEYGSSFSGYDVDVSYVSLSGYGIANVNPAVPTGVQTSDLGAYTVTYDNGSKAIFVSECFTLSGLLPAEAEVPVAGLVGLGLLAGVGLVGGMLRNRKK